MEKYILEAAVIILTPLIGILITKGLGYLGVKITREQNKYLEDLAAQGVALAAEEAARYLKNRNEPFASEAKKRIAINHVKAQLPKIDEVLLDRVITVTVAKTKGEGATG